MRGVSGKGEFGERKAAGEKGSLAACFFVRDANVCEAFANIDMELLQGNGSLDGHALAHALVGALTVDGLHPAVVANLVGGGLLQVELDHAAGHDLVDVLLDHRCLVGSCLLDGGDDELLHLVLGHVHARIGGDLVAVD